MKTLKNHTLLYDDSCPVCTTYTQAFIKYKLLDEFGRMNYSNGITEFKNKINADKARNEIALINTNSGEVKYGIDSLIYILGYNNLFLKFILSFKSIQFILKKLYAFISFNRKVIAGAKNNVINTCEPDFNIQYRLLYLIITGLFTASVLLAYSKLLFPLIPHSNLVREYAICFGQIVFQSLLLISTKHDKKSIFNYLGNMMTVSLIGGLLLIPMLLTTYLITLNTIMYLLYFMLIVLVMLLIHKKRVKNLHAPFWLSLTWVFYRCLILFIII